MPASGSPKFIDAAAAAHLAVHLRGIAGVTLRILGQNAHAEAEMTALLHKLGILVDSIPVGEIVPTPLRRFTFQYSGRNAVLTINPDAPLLG